MAKKARKPKVLSISPSKLERGIKECLLNANDLLTVAKLAYGRRKFGSAVSLSILSLEELGKISVLKEMGMYSPGSQRRWPKAWKMFRDHDRKNLQANYAVQSNQSSRDAFERLKAAEGYLHNSAPLVRFMRESGFYVDFSEKTRTWIIPRRISESIAGSHLRKARDLWTKHEALQRSGYFSKEAMVLRRKLYGPVLKIMTKQRMKNRIFVKNLLGNQWKEASESFNQIAREHGIIKERVRGYIGGKRGWIQILPRK